MRSIKKDDFFNNKSLSYIFNNSDNEKDENCGLINSKLFYTSKICEISEMIDPLSLKKYCKKSYDLNNSLKAISEIKINEKIKNTEKVCSGSIVEYHGWYISKALYRCQDNQISKPNAKEAKSQYCAVKKINLIFEKANLGNLLEFINCNPFYFHSLKNLKSLLIDIISGLKQLHKLGIIHNDLRCENILIFIKDKKAKSIKAKICDFNSSLLANSQQCIRDNFNCFTKFGFYELPKFSTDYFELGIVLFQTLFFENPLKYLERRPITQNTRQLDISTLKLNKNVLTIEYDKLDCNINKDYNNDLYVPYYSNKANLMVDDSYQLNISQNKNFNNLKNETLKILLKDLLQLNPNNRPNDDTILAYSFFKSKKYFNNHISITPNNDPFMNNNNNNNTDFHIQKNKKLKIINKKIKVLWNPRRKEIITRLCL